MQSWWKSPNFMGNLAYYAFRFLRLTLDVRVKMSSKIDPNGAYLASFWHGKQFLPAVNLYKLHKTARCALVSPSRDGAMLSVFLKRYGYHIIRGSSRDGGGRALRHAKIQLQKGFSIGFAVDGPIGPIYVIKPGVVYLAQRCNTQIVPIGVAYKRYWTFHKAWDKFQLPKPFSRAALVIGEPYTVDGGDIKTACVDLEKRMHQLEQEAHAML